MMKSILQDLHGLSCAARILAAYGHEDLTLGHVALRDPEGRGIWMKRRGISLGEVQEAADFLLVDWDGHVLAGDGARHGEWPIHTEVMLARPEISVSLHSHPAYATLLSATETSLMKITQDGLRLGEGEIPRYTGTADLIVSRLQGRALAADLGNASILLMKNHGVSIYAESIEKLTLTGVFLERAASTFVQARAAGLELETPELGDAKMVLGSLDAAGFVSDNWNYLVRELNRREGHTLVGRS